jgi:hypothetical protein
MIDEVDLQIVGQQSPVEDFHSTFESAEFQSAAQ